MFCYNKNGGIKTVVQYLCKGKMWACHCFPKEKKHRAHKHRFNKIQLILVFLYALYCLCTFVFKLKEHSGVFCNF